MEKKKIKILLVEDEAITAMLEILELQKLGYSLKHVSNGEDAVLEALNNEEGFDVILMDIDLGPGIDGTQAAEEILKEKDIPVVFLSSPTESEIVENTEKITSYGYVVKNSVFVILDASIKMALKLFYEKMERKLAEKAMCEKEQKYRTLFEQSTEGIYFHDLKGHILDINEMACLQSGYSREELIGLTVFDCHPGTSPINQSKGKIIQAWGQWVPGQRFTIEAEHQTKDGKVYPVVVSTGKVCYGDTVVMFAIVKDITDLRQAEKEIKKQLIEKEVLLREFHHRIKNNFINIEGLLSCKADLSKNPEVKTELQDSIACIHCMYLLYDKMLLSANYQDISIKSYVEDLIDSVLVIYATGKNISINKQMPDIKIDPKRAILIGIIINELLTNTLKYAFAGRNSGIVSITINKDDNTLTLIIKDNGIGVDEKRKSNEFSGFGLKIVQMLVEQLAGTYSVANENGTKTIISFKI